MMKKELNTQNPKVIYNHDEGRTVLENTVLYFAIVLGFIVTLRYLYSNE